jgi:REDY-like protein HapK
MKDCCLLNIIANLSNSAHRNGCTSLMTPERNAMSALILRYRLNDGIAVADFERWVAEVDHPAMRSLRRVKRFETYRVVGLLMGAGAPSSDYVEIFEIDDLPGFTSEDMAGDTVQSVMGSFMGFAEAPEFLIAEAVDPSA